MLLLLLLFHWTLVLHAPAVAQDTIIKNSHANDN